MASIKPILYSYYKSSASWRVRTALAYKNIEYEYKTVTLHDGEQNTTSFSELNPMKQVPALYIDGTLLSQSLPIIEYIDSRYPENRLLPEDLVQRAQSRMIAEIINSGTQPLQNLSVLKELSKVVDHKSEITAAWAHLFVNKGLKAVDDLVKQTSGKYCVGDSISIADLCVVPQIYHAIKRFNTDVSSKYPTLYRIYEDLSKVDSFIKAHADNQPDTPK